MNLDEKTYEQFMEEALLKLPLYNKEWSDYSLSDPGITILEYLTAFTVLQQSKIYEKTEPIQEALLKDLSEKKEAVQEFFYLQKM